MVMLSTQNECILALDRKTAFMSNTQVQHFISEVENLCEDDKLQVISIILESLRVSSRKSMDDEVVSALFEKFTGCIKADAQVDSRKEKCEYLDERFGA